MNKQSFSKLWIIVIALILIGGGVLVYRYLGLEIPKEEVQPPEAEEEVEESTAWETYRNEEYRFEIKYPSNWIKKEQVMGSVVVFLSPRESASDIFQENLNVMIQDLSTQPMTPEEYLDLSLNQIRQITDSNIIDLSETTLVNSPAHKIVYTGKYNQHNLKWMQVWTIKNNKAYIITYTAEIDKYSDFLEIIQKMINSFKLV